VLFLHEVHHVIGACEEAFEAAYRDGCMPALAHGDDARLLFFAHHAHGTSRAYNVVTLTAVRDGAAWERVARRLQVGDLHDWATDVDRMRHRVTAKVLLPVPWSPLQDVDLESVPTSGHHELTLFMEDTAWPHEGKLDEYLEAARTNYAPSLEEGRHAGRSLVELRAVFQPAWGAGRHREVVLWQKVVEPRRITTLITTEIPPEHRGPGTWMHDALRVRDDWESRLLRTTSWSPWY
jgi:hypothetical protein